MDKYFYVLPTMGSTALTDPIGSEMNYHIVPVYNGFLGFFNGNNISNIEISLNIIKEVNGNIGLFSSLGTYNPDASIKTGISTLKNISVTGRVVGLSANGGIVGKSYASIIQNCTNYASVSTCS